MLIDAIGFTLSASDIAPLALCVPVKVYVVDSDVTPSALCALDVSKNVAEEYREPIVGIEEYGLGKLPDYENLVHASVTRRRNTTLYKPLIWWRLKGSYPSGFV